MTLRDHRLVIDPDVDAHFKRNLAWPRKPPQTQEAPVKLLVGIII